MKETQVQVLVIGGSLVGLSAAMFLAQRGVRTLSVEKHRGTAIHPRAGYFQLRTMESRTACAPLHWRCTTRTAG